MTVIRWALLADGSSDRVLIPIIRWVMLETCPDLRITERPEFRRRQPKELILEEMKKLVQESRPDVLFVHRDAEGKQLVERHLEIPALPHPVVKVIPVRMTEAWLLIEDQAIRAAAGNPNGSAPLALPSLKQLEDLPDPKGVLHESILVASELSGRRRSKLRKDLGHRVQLVSENLCHLTRLRFLPAFRSFEGEARKVLSSL